MAQAKKKRSKKPAGPGKKPASPAKPAAERTPLFHREIRPYIYAGFDFAMAILYVILFTSVMPNRHGWVNGLMYLFVAAVAVMGVAMFIRNRKGWWAAVGACGALLLLWIVLLALILSSAAFLAGVYGAMGKAASSFALLAAALSIQVVAMLPALQLKFLMTRAGRRYFKQEPLWG